MSTPIHQLPLFCFGTLMDPEVLRIVSDMPLEQLDIHPATVIDHVQRQVEGEVFPMLIRAPGAEADGCLIHGLSEHALDRILFFEGDEYRLDTLTVRVDDKYRAACYFRDSEIYRISEQSWSLADWQATERASFIEKVRDYMAMHGSMSKTDADAFW